MSRGGKLRSLRSAYGAGALLIACGAAVLALTWMAYRSDTAFAGRAVTVTAVVDRVVPGERTIDSEGNPAYGTPRLDVSYQAGGRTFHRRLSSGGTVHRAGDKITVGYDPERPGFAVAPPPSTNPEAGVYVFGAIGALLVLLGLLRATDALHRWDSRRRRRRRMDRSRD